MVGWVEEPKKKKKLKKIGEKEADGTTSQKVQERMDPLLLTSHVTLGKILYIPMPQFPIL